MYETDFLKFQFKLILEHISYIATVPCLPRTFRFAVLEGLIYARQKYKLAQRWCNVGTTVPTLDQRWANLYCYLPVNHLEFAKRTEYVFV